MKIIFAIIFLMIIFLLVKKTMSLNVIWHNKEGIIRLKIGMFHIQKRIAIVERKRKFQTVKKMSMKASKKVMHHVEFQKIHLDLCIGLLFFMATIYGIPLIAYCLALLQNRYANQLRKFSYFLKPNYSQQFSLDFQLEIIFKMRPIYLVYLFL